MEVREANIVRGIITVTVMALAVAALYALWTLPDITWSDTGKGLNTDTYRWR